MLVVAEDWYLASHRLPLIRAARESGWRVIAATRVRAHREPIEAAGAEVVALGIRREGRHPLHEWQAVHELAELYRARRPDVVHHVGLKPILYGGMAARMAGVPSMVNALAGMGSLFAHTDRAHLLRSILQVPLRAVLRRQGSVVLVQNVADAELLRERGLARPEQVRLVPGSGVDLTAFTESQEPPGSHVVLLPARLLRDKGIEEFIEAAISLRGIAHFVLVGATDPANPTSIPQARIEDAVSSGVVEWWGHRSDMAGINAKATIVVLPSYREGMPKALMEAAASGRAIVTTDVPGCRDVVEHGVNGLLVPPRDAEALAAAIKELLDDPERRAAMGRAGRAKAEREFDDMELARQTVAIYEELLG